MTAKELKPKDEVRSAGIVIRIMAGPSWSSRRPGLTYVTINGMTGWYPTKDLDAMLEAGAEVYRPERPKKFTADVISIELGALVVALPIDAYAEGDTLEITAKRVRASAQ